jgi:hypothetical protein
VTPPATPPAVGVTALTLLAGAGSPAQAAFTDRPNSLAGAGGTAPLANGGWFRERIHTLTDEDWYRFDVPKPTQVVVTLGGLPADYSLSVFDAAGRRKGGSNFRGRAFERVVFNATGTGAATTRPRATPSRPAGTGGTP